MKKSFNLLCAVVISLFMLTACGKESGGSSLLALLGLGSGSSTTFMKQFGATVSGSNALPFKAEDSKTQYLYTAAEISASGLISKIRFRQEAETTAAATCQNVTIKMGHTNRTTLSTTWTDNIATGQGSEVTVFNNKTVSIPSAAAESWFEITLDAPFNYNGVDNLIVDIERTTACTAEVAVTDYNTGTSHRVWSDETDGTPGTPEYNASSGLADGNKPWMQFVFAGGDNHLIYSGSSNMYPFTTNSSYQRVQLLYSADQIKSNGAGIITGVGFLLGADSDGRDYTISVRLGHTTLSALVDTSWDANFNSGAPVTVADAASFKVPAGAPAGSTIWIPFSRSFEYNGTDNLVVDVNVTAASGWMSLEMNSAGSGTRVLGSSSAPSEVSDARYSIKLRFKGGTADVITAGDYDYGPPFYHVSGSQMQNLYRPCDTGLNGRITRIGFRLKNDSVAETYQNFSIVVGYTANTLLGSGVPFASNMDSPVTVFSGTATVPAGLKAGDWIDIPLTTPFTGDPTKNLAVYIKSDQGTASQLNTMRGEGDATRFASLSSFVVDTISTTPSNVTNSIMDIRFGY